MVPYIAMHQEEEKLIGFFNKYPQNEYQRKDLILGAKNPYENLYFIEDGVVRSYYTSSDGIEFTVNVLKPGTIFPLSGFLAGIVNPYDFEAFTDAKIRKAPKEIVRKFIYENQDLSQYFLEKFSRGIEGYVIRSQFLTKGSAFQKVASSLLFLVKRFGIQNRKKLKINLPLTHQEVANLSGITRETATIYINELEKKKIVERQGRFISILHEDELKKIASASEDGLRIDFSY